MSNRMLNLLEGEVFVANSRLNEKSDLRRPLHEI
jgi:hypothetical protein